MGEKRHYIKFLCLILMAFVFFLVFYLAPIDLRVDSSFILSHVQYFASRHGILNSPTSTYPKPTTATSSPTTSTSSPRKKPEYDCSPNRRRWMADDLLCSNPPKFLPQYKNPCFYQTSAQGVHTLRCLPYFHIFGVCKSGTTDLFRRLIKHPQILPNKGVIQKETWYWTWKRYGKSTFKIYGNKGRQNQLMLFRQYLRLFDAERISQMKVSNFDHTLYSDLVTGSGDPMDFWDHTQWRFIPQNNITWSEPQFTAPDLMKHVLPQIKLIVMLRDPIERLYSHYYHGGFGNSPNKFHMDILSSINILKKCRQEFTLRSCLYNQTVMNAMSTPLYASFYHVHLKNWLDVFPRQQVHIIRTEDFGKDISGHMLDVFQFLNLSDVKESLLKNISNPHHEYQTATKRKAGPMLPETWEILRALFESENQKLVTLLNDTRFSWHDVYTEHVSKNKVGKDSLHTESTVSSHTKSTVSSHTKSTVSSHTESTVSSHTENTENMTHAEKVNQTIIDVIRS